MVEPPANRPSAARFPTTCWSRIVAAGDPAHPAARTALEDLYRDYRYPVYAFIRRRGYPADEAEDLVQDFLTVLLLERGDLADLDRSRGRFRAFLIAACTHYLANHHRGQRTRKRGGGRQVISLDQLDAEGRYIREPAHDLTAERLYERQWALTLLGHVLARLEAEAEAAGKGPLFARLRPALQGDALAPSYRDIGAVLGLTEGAVRVAAHRLRARYRELLRAEVARTTDDPSAVDEEITAMMEALASR